MFDYQPLLKELENLGAGVWAEQLADQLTSAFDLQAHGDLPRWLSAIEAMPSLTPSSVDLLDSVRMGCQGDLSEVLSWQLREHLMALHPWRKGPYQVMGVEVDAEWRSDWKWERLKPHIASLQNRMVLDVGCGNGYHCWRMLGAGARLVVGVDPMLLNIIQFQALKKLYGQAAVYVLPLGVEDLPVDMKLFDTVFSMGVLYHRRSPIEHLLELRGCLRSGGELVLETLVIEGAEDSVLVPEDRYAQMRNVWFLPSCKALMLWMRRCGFKNIKLVDVTKTSVQEQRSTEWMRFYSLKNFLNVGGDLTCEGLPAPIRALITASVD